MPRHPLPFARRPPSRERGEHSGHCNETASMMRNPHLCFVQLLLLRIYTVACALEATRSSTKVGLLQRDLLSMLAPLGSQEMVLPTASFISVLEQWRTNQLRCHHLHHTTTLPRRSFGLITSVGIAVRLREGYLIRFSASYRLIWKKTKSCVP